MTRREMNHSLLLALAALFPASREALLKAAPLPTEGSSGRLPAVQETSVTVRTLMEEPLAPMPDAEISVITLTVPPGSVSPPHRHIGPVFAYILEGKIENQVDPHPPQTYGAGQYFYEPPRHVHRLLRNLSQTQPATLLIFQVGEKGKKFTVPAK